MNRDEEEPPEPTYRIGAVSRLTGVAPDTLRVWERRYGAVVPMRSEKGSRLYSQKDIVRLALIKRLVDSGDSISCVANLDRVQLVERAKGAPETEPGAAQDRACRVAVLGHALAEKLEWEKPGDDPLELMGFFRDREALIERAPGLDVDVLILEYATIQPEQLRDIGTVLQRSGAACAIVVYGFAARTTLERLESARVIPLRAPVGGAELRRWCSILRARPALARSVPAEVGIDISGPLPVQRFDAETLVKIAAASVTVRCECPHHLVDLISGLNAFEAYSQECEALNVDDAALHACLHSATAEARSLLETALVHVADAIEIEDEN